jgi:chromosome segregation ATPase
MLKKNDLAKQFELVVQQEIKNYNDSLNMILGSLREIKDEIQEIKKKADEKEAKLESWKVKCSAEFSEIKNVLDGFATVCHRNLNLQERKNGELEARIGYIQNDLNQRQNHAFFPQIVEKLGEKIEEIQKKVEGYEKTYISEINRLETKTARSVESVRREILYTPGELDLVKRQLEEKIASHSVDVSGIMKELSIYKHDNYITEKKIENLYTQVERLKKKEPQ